MKQNLHAIADTKYQYFQTNLWLVQVYMQNSACIKQLLYLDHAQEPGVGDVISEIWQKKVETK